jgi:hypothetical protein
LVSYPEGRKNGNGVCEQGAEKKVGLRREKVTGRWIRFA